MAIFNPGQPAPTGAQRLKARRKEQAANELFNVRRAVGATFAGITLEEAKWLREAGLDWYAWARSQSPELTSYEAEECDRPQPESLSEAPCGQQ